MNPIIRKYAGQENTLLFLLISAVLLFSLHASAEVTCVKMSGKLSGSLVVSIRENGIEKDKVNFKNNIDAFYKAFYDCENIAAGCVSIAGSNRSLHGDVGYGGGFLIPKDAKAKNTGNHKLYNDLAECNAHGVSDAKEKMESILDSEKNKGFIGLNRVEVF